MKPTTLFPLNEFVLTHMTSGVQGKKGEIDLIVRKTRNFYLTSTLFVTKIMTSATTYGDTELCVNHRCIIILLRCSTAFRDNNEFNTL